VHDIHPAAIATADTADAADAGAERLWSARGLPYEAWLCRLAAHLLRTCPPTGVLRLLAAAAGVQAGVAAQLLPHALQVGAARA
jgi:hypothetical protein